MREKTCDREERRGKKARTRPIGRRCPLFFFCLLFFFTSLHNFIPSTPEPGCACFAAPLRNHQPERHQFWHLDEVNECTEYEVGKKEREAMRVLCVLVFLASNWRVGRPVARQGCLSCVFSGALCAYRPIGWIGHDRGGKGRGVSKGRKDWSYGDDGQGRPAIQRARPETDSDCSEDRMADPDPEHKASKTRFTVAERYMLSLCFGLLFSFTPSLFFCLLFSCRPAVPSPTHSFQSKWKNTVERAREPQPTTANQQVRGVGKARGKPVGYELHIYTIHYRLPRLPRLLNIFLRVLTC